MFWVSTNRWLTPTESAFAVASRSRLGCLLGPDYRREAERSCDPRSRDPQTEDPWAGARCCWLPWWVAVAPFPGRRELGCSVVDFLFRRVWQGWLPHDLFPSRGPNPSAGATGSVAQSPQRDRIECEDERLLARIRELHAADRYAYGYRRVRLGLRRAGERVRRSRVQRLSRANRMVGAKRAAMRFSSRPASHSRQHSREAVAHDETGSAGGSVGRISVQRDFIAIHPAPR
jgi:hypothetical protein